MKAGGEGDEREWDGWMAWLNGHEFEHTLGDGKIGKLSVLQSMGLQSQTWLSNWTTEKEVRGIDDKKEQKYDKIQDKKH